jgi:transposase
MIGLDLAKNVFQVHGADASGACVYSKKLRRSQVLDFFAKQEPCIVVMEACAGAHYWSREIAKLGHDARQVAPSYAKPFVKRGKNDAVDAEALVEAGQRPNMRFVAVKSEEKQASALVLGVRDTFVRQRTQLINALRGHLGEYGIVAPQGPQHVKSLIAAVEDPASGVPAAARKPLAALVEMLRMLTRHIAEHDAEIARRAKDDETARRLTTIPGVGPIIATASEALAPPPEMFKRGRDFAAWLGIPPLQHSSGGKERPGKSSKMGCKTLRRLLILGAASVVRQAVKKGAPAGSWLARMLARKPRALVINALANKMARIIWALLAKGGVYRAPVTAA